MPTYIIRAGESGPVKIGWAEDVAPRLRTLQTAHYETLTVIREIDTWWHSEAQIQERFKSYRLRGEWFFFCDEMMTFIPPTPEQDNPAGQRAAAHAMLVEANRHVQRLIGEPTWTESRPQMFARAALACGLSAPRVRSIFYMKDIAVHAHEIDALRAAQPIAAPRTEGARPGAAEALQLGKMGE